MRTEDSKRGDTTVAYTSEVNIHTTEELFLLKKSITTRTDGYTLAMQKFSLEIKKKSF